MLQRLRELVAGLGRAMRRFFYRVMDALSAARVGIAALVLLAAIGYVMYQHPPLKTVAQEAHELARLYAELAGSRPQAARA